MATCELGVISKRVDGTRGFQDLMKCLRINVLKESYS